MSLDYSEICPTCDSNNTISYVDGYECHDCGSSWVTESSDFDLVDCEGECDCEECQGEEE
jgi:hypothetical protein